MRRSGCCCNQEEDVSCSLSIWLSLLIHSLTHVSLWRWICVLTRANPASFLSTHWPRLNMDSLYHSMILTLHICDRIQKNWPCQHNKACVSITWNLISNPLWERLDLFLTVSAAIKPQLCITGWKIRSSVPEQIQLLNHELNHRSKSWWCQSVTLNWSSRVSDPCIVSGWTFWTLGVVFFCFSIVF